MGAIPVLLKLVAVMGITYGWQPDQNGGVEYIVQVSPDELAHIERAGDLKTEIDPAVRGHVSRIIVRVGNKKLPRQTPSNLIAQSSRTKAQSSVRLATSDYMSVDVPEIARTSNSSDNRIVVAKPQNEGPGFSLPPSLSDAASSATQAARDQIDRAGRNLLQRGSDQLGSTVSNALRNAPLNNIQQGSNRKGADLLPLPGTRTPNPKLAPPFTGSDPNGEFARRRSGGPSTEPINTRDRTWNEFAGTRSGGPSTEPSGASQLGGTTAQQRAQVNQTAGQSSRRGTGLGPSDTFGKMPGGLSLPNNNAQTNNAAPSLQSPRGSILSQREQTLLDQKNQLASDTRNQNPAARAELSARQKGASAQPTGPDPRLTAAEVAAGGWTIDSSGRALDRYGQLLPPAAPQTQTPPNASFARLNAPGQSQANHSHNAKASTPQQSPFAATQFTQNQQPQNPFKQGQLTGTEQHQMGPTNQFPYQGNQAQSQFSQTANPQNQFNAQLNQPQPMQTQGHGGQSAHIHRMNQPQGYPQNNQPTAQTSIYRTDLSQNRRPPIDQDTPSLSNRASSSLAPPSRSEPKQVAAQPLFNGLLLLSFVANIYLMFWLKNLRLQFRDLVAAKRMANANTTAV